MNIKLTIRPGLFNEIVPARFMDDEDEGIKYSGKLITKDMIQGIREGKIAELVACESMNGVSLLIGETFVFIPQSNILALLIEGVFDGTVGTDDDESAE